MSANPFLAKDTPGWQKHNNKHSFKKGQTDQENGPLDPHSRTYRK